MAAIKVVSNKYTIAANRTVTTPVKTFHPGEIVELSNEDAKHLIKRGFIINRAGDTVLGTAEAQFDIDHKDD